jgi:hypothetical protein
MSNLLLSVIVNFLESRGWPHTQMPGRNVITFPFQGDNERWTVYAEAREEDWRVIFYSVVPFNVPKERRLPVAEFITRANYGLSIGNFELDLADGEVRFKTSIDVKGAQLTPKLVERAVVMNLHAMNTYLPGITALMDEASASPIEIIAGIESQGGR